MTTYEEFMDAHTARLRHMTPDDHRLASLLMRAAFPDAPEREAEIGIGPLYVIQTISLRDNRELRAEIMALLKETLN